MSDLTLFEKQVQKFVDVLQIKQSTVSAKQYVPYFRIVIDVAPFFSHHFDAQGPFLFDMTTNLTLRDTPLDHVVYKKVDSTISFLAPKRSAKLLVDKACKQVVHDLSTVFFQSTLVPSILYTDRERVTNRNYQILKQELVVKYKAVDHKLKRDIIGIKEKKRVVAKKIFVIKQYFFSIALRRTLFSLFARKQRLMSPKERLVMQKKKQKRKSLKKELHSFDIAISKLKKSAEKEKETLELHVYKKAQDSVKQISYKPKRSDMTIHGTLLFMPKKKYQV